jgi:hypothetical protein
MSKTPAKHASARLVAASRVMKASATASTGGMMEIHDGSMATAPKFI